MFDAVSSRSGAVIDDFELHNCEDKCAFNDNSYHVDDRFGLLS